MKSVTYSLIASSLVLVVFLFHSAETASGPKIALSTPTVTARQPSEVTAVRFADASTVITGAKDGRLRFWRVGMTKPVREIDAHSSSIVALAVSRDGRQLATTDGQHLRIWALPTGKREAEIEASVTDLSFSPNGETIRGVSLDKSIRTWNARTTELLGTVSYSDPRPAIAARLSPDGHRAVFAVADG